MYWFRCIVAKIRHWRYVRYLMYGNRESRKRERINTIDDIQCGYIEIPEEY